MKKLIILDIVGLSKKQFEKLKPKNISKILEHGSYGSFDPSFPAVTCSVQASIFSGTYPSEHGIISNGYYDELFKKISFDIISMSLFRTNYYKIYEKINCFRYCWFIKKAI